MGEAARAREAYIYVCMLYSQELDGVLQRTEGGKERVCIILMMNKRNIKE